MRAPDFWNRSAGIIAGLLMPGSAVWRASAQLRHALARPYRAPIPVICVGNLVAGGAGKTPIVLSLVSLLRERGDEAHVVARGYGGSLRGPVRVDPARHAASDVGDEALLIAAQAPCWIGRDRAAAVRAAAAAGAAAIVLDDGFQNPTVAKHLSLVVVDAGFGFGNGRVIPAGPLREPIATGMRRADAVVLLDSVGEQSATVCTSGLPLLRANVEPIDGGRLKGRRVYAFAGIGRPQKFFATLRRTGAEVAGSRAFPDHHPFSADEIAILRREAQRANARLITTAKDIVRLAPELRAGIDVLEITIQWHDPAALAGLLARVVLSPAGDGSGSPQSRR